MTGMTPGCRLADLCGAIHPNPLDHRDYGVYLMIDQEDGESRFGAVSVYSFPTALAAHEWAVRQMWRTVEDVLDDRDDLSETIPGPNGDLACYDHLGDCDDRGRPIVGWEVEWWTPNLPGLPVGAGLAGEGRIRRDNLHTETHTAYGLAFYDEEGTLVGDLGAVAYTEDGAVALARAWAGRRASELPSEWRETDTDARISTVSVDELLVRFTDAERVKGCLVSPPVECEATQGQVACIAVQGRVA